MTLPERLVADYIAAYNRFDVAGMTAHLSDDVVFENIQDGVVTLRMEGIAAFRQQATAALAYFSSRTQTVLSLQHSGNTIEVCIQYSAVTAVDFPNGLRKGEPLVLSGTSFFYFKANRICRIVDSV